MTRSLAARRGLAAAALAPLLLTGVAACGSDSGSDSSGTHATTSDAPAGSAVLAGLQKGDEVDADDFVDTVADGVENSTTAHITMKMDGDGSGGMTGEGDIDYTGKSPAMSMSMAVPGVKGEQQMVLVDGIMYIQSAAFGGGKYIKIDPSDPNGPLASTGLDKTLKQADPAGQLESLRPAIDKVSYVGEEEVDGRQLDHYEMTVDVQKVLKTMGTDKLPSSAATAMPKTLTYDLWLDDQDRFSQMKMDYPIMGQQIAMTMTADDWGKKVSIKAPPPDQVTDMPDLGDLSQGSGADGA